MPRAINVDVDNTTVRVILQRSNGTVSIMCDYTLRGDGVEQGKVRSFVPADFTATERTALGNAFTIVRDKARSQEAV